MASTLEPRPHRPPPRRWTLRLLAAAPLLAALAAGALSEPASSPPSSPTVPTPPAQATPELPPPLPPPTPPPEPAPLATPLPATSTGADVLDLLWGHRIEFGPGGQPLVTIRLMEGQDQLVIRTVGRARLAPRGGPSVELPAGTRLVVRARQAVAARLQYAPLLAEAAWADRGAVEAARADWDARGVPVRSRTIGGVYGIAGRVVDSRRQQLLAEGDRTERGAQALVEALQARAGQRFALDVEPVARPRGRLEVSSEAGPLGSGDSAVSVEPAGEGGLAVESLEHALDGKAAREERRYRTRLVATLDAAGRLALVAVVPLEELLRGLVPAEMPALSHLEALKAQAVTARSNVLAQLGTRHLADPYVICAEVHCQAYRGAGAEHPRTDEAIRATAGEALFGKADRTLVDGVYSALCGGHGEDNDAVWPVTASASLRGQPDLVNGGAAAWAGGLREEPVLRRFLAAPGEAWCRRPAAARKDRFRWERRFTPTDLELLGEPLGVGEVRGVKVVSRGVSGRATTLRVEGQRGAIDVTGELTIRRLLRNLPSAMFVVDREGEDWVLHGGGWGHGAGMCQWGAVGRAEAGQGYRQILRAYFSGAEVAKIY
jgi:SpoIID/LytB domain protein